MSGGSRSSSSCGSSGGSLLMKLLLMLLLLHLLVLCGGRAAMCDRRITEWCQIAASNKHITVCAICGCSRWWWLLAGSKLRIGAKRRGYLLRFLDRRSGSRAGNCRQKWHIRRRRWCCGYSW